MEPVLANRLRNLHRHLRKWGRRTDSTAWRLYERDIPAYPLVIDWYDQHAVCWLLERRREEAEAETRRDEFRTRVLEQIMAGLDLPAERVVLKSRRREAGAERYRPDHAQSLPVVVREHGLSLHCDLGPYVDTGLFMDHRQTRQWLRERVAGKSVLNLFAYTGAFTVAAAASDAAATLSVDLSNTYVAWQQKNLALNNLTDERRHRHLRIDCLRYLAESSTERFDYIICDPPTFSTSTAMARDFAVGPDHPWLLWRCWNRLAPGGTIIFSTNDRTFRLAEHGLPPGEWTETTPDSIPEDFRNRRIHRCWRVVRS